MKKVAFLLAIIICSVACNQNGNEKPGLNENNSQAEAHQTDATTEPLFDSIRAQKNGADDYGMRKYVMAFLKRGPNRSQDSATAAKLQMAHMENIGKMAEAGKLALAGPFFGDGDLRGIYVFAVESIEEAQALTSSDPAIQAGSLEMELIPWYGSAALMEVGEIHNKIAKIEI